MAEQLGGKVEGGHHREFGRAEVEVAADSPLFEGVWRKGEKYPVWMSHGDRVTKLPPGFKVLGTSPNAPIAIIGDDARKFYATQFHLEVMHTPHGAALLAQFRAQDRGAFRRLDHARLQAGGDRENPRAGRQGPRHLRTVRRRRLGGRRRLDPRGDRRAAHLRVRRPRPAAARRSAEGGDAVPRQLQHPAGARRRRRHLPDSARRRRRPRAEAQDHRQIVHRRVRGARRRKSAAPNSWRKARSIPT